MRWDSSATPRRPGQGVVVLTLLGAALAAGPAAAQQQQPGSALPSPRLLTVMPCGAKAGSTVEVAFTGTDLDEPQTLAFSAPGFQVEPVVAAPDPKNPQAKPPVTKFKVTAPDNARLGNHDVRFVGKYGISNPRVFVVGDLPEVLEKEPNNDVGEAQRIDLNTTVNGVISAGPDVDYYVFAGKKGQRVVFSCLASSIDSRLDATVEVYDAADKQLAFNRVYHGNDALTDCTLPADGDYRVRVSHFTHLQANAEFFYRLSVSTAPWIDAVHPAVVEPGKPAQLTVYGRNLPGGKPDPAATIDGRVLEKVAVTVNVPADAADLQRLSFSGHVPPAGTFLDGFEYRLRNDVGSSNAVLLTYARAPLVLENEANDTADAAQEVPLPCEIAGRIEKKRDRDWYSFTAKKGEVWNVELFGHRLGTASDMKFVLRNPAKEQDIIEAVDNPDILNPKLFVKTSDPAVYRFTVPADGKYQLLVKSLNGDVLAGPRQFYRVRITQDQPDFRLVVMPYDFARPDACVVPQGNNQVFTVFAARADGWNGNITLTVEGLPPGVTCAPQTLPAGLRQASLVVSAAPDAAPWAGEIKVKGTATIQGQAVVREARPASITWPVQPGANIPTVTRLDRALVLAVRDPAPYQLAATIDKAVLQAGDKANVTLKLTRVSPDFKNPLTVQALDLPNNLVGFNNNQPLNMAPGKDEATAVLDVKTNTPPGTYTIVLRSQAQIPFNKDPQAKQKQPIVVVLPSNVITVTVLPKTVAAVALAPNNPALKAGTETEVTVKVTRQFDYAGEFKVQLVLPPNVKGVSADEVVIPAGKDEVKLLLKADPDAAPGARNDLVVRATATLQGNVQAVQEVKFNVNVTK